MLQRTPTFKGFRYQFRHKFIFSPNLVAFADHQAILEALDQLLL